MNRLILLTGATGFVGSHILRKLLGEGQSVRAVVRDAAKLPEGVAEVLISSDIFAENAEWWARACCDVDIVIHVGWYAEPGKYLYAPENLACLCGTLALADGAMRADISRFVGVGTCFEYDLSHRVLGTDTPLAPTTPYAAAKAAAFLALSNILPEADISFAWCRLFYLYGEGEPSGRLVPYLRERLAAGEPAELTTGRQVRDFLDVTEAAEMVAATAVSKIEGAINICSGVPLTVRQLAERIADEYGRRDLLHFGSRPENAVDPDCVVGLPTIAH